MTCMDCQRAEQATDKSDDEPLDYTSLLLHRHTSRHADVNAGAAAAAAAAPRHTGLVPSRLFYIDPPV